MTFKAIEKNNRIIFVDPYIFRKETPGYIAKSIARACFHLLKYPIMAHRLAMKVNYDMTRISNYSRWLDRHLCMASFYNTYSRLFSDDMLLNSKYVSHTISNIGVTDKEKMNQARELIRLYAGAKLIVTSRIHAALPCLALETPVIFIPSEGLNATRENAGRFEGLEDFFNVIRWKSGNLLVESEDLAKQLVDGKINSNINVKNPDKYVTYRDQLIQRVRSFTNNYNN